MVGVKTKRGVIYLETILASFADIPCSGSKSVCLRIHGDSEKNQQKGDGESWRHFEITVVWGRRECCSTSIQFCCELYTLEQHL